MSEWKYWTPERDGHAPDDWVEGLYVEFEYSASDWRACPNKKPFWSSLKQYRYRPLQDATYDCGTGFEQQAVALLLHLNTMGENWSAVRVRDGGWEVVRPYSQEAILAACQTRQVMNDIYVRLDEAIAAVQDNLAFSVKVDIIKALRALPTITEEMARSTQDAKYEPDLLAQCLALPQDQREALIEAMQKPQRDWADDVWFEAFWAWDPMKADGKKAAAVIRSMCRPKEEQFK